MQRGKVDLDGQLPSTKKGFKYSLGIDDNSLAFVRATALKGKTYQEEMEASTDNWTNKLGVLELLVSDQEFVEQAESYIDTRQEQEISITIPLTRGPVLA